MSKIDDLIKELCPNGVEYKKLKNISIMQRGQSITSKDLTVGRIPVIAGGQLPSTYNDIYNRDGETITVSGSGAYAGYVNYWNEPILCTDSFSIKSEEVNMRFLYHFLKMNQKEIYNKKKGAGIPHVHISDLEDMNIPIPPLEVQEEIVRILDKFGKLEAELEAELEVRKSQYEFWRGKVFDSIDAKLVKLSDLCKIGDGLHGTPNYLNDGEYYFINGNNLLNGKIIYDDKTRKVSKTEFENQNIKLDENTLLMSINGTIGKVSYYNGEKIMLGKSVAYFNILDEKVLSKKYLYYLLQAPNSVRYYNDSLTGSTILNLGLKAIREFEIPLPPIDEQNRISNILEHFDKLINDITIGLPSEIELRRQQYEYYRNKLLSFEVSVNG